MVGNHTLSEDKLKYTFTLRPGLAFHDGSKVTTKDVIPSIKRWMLRDSAGQKLNEVTASIDATDDNTFTLTLKEPYGLVLFTLASTAGSIPGIMPEAAADRRLHRAQQHHRLRPVQVCGGRARLGLEGRLRQA